MHVHCKKVRKSSKKLQKQLEKYLKEKKFEILGEGNSFGIRRKQSFLNTSGNTEITESSTPTLDTTNTHIRKQKLDVLTDDCEKSETAVAETECTTEVELPINKKQAETEDADINAGKELKLQRRQSKQKRKHSQFMQNMFRKFNKEFDKEYFNFLQEYKYYVEMMPWSKLMEEYESGNYQLWCLNYSKNSLVTVTKTRKRPSVLHYNIKFFETKNSLKPPCDIVKYIVNKETPLGKSKDHLFVLLLETNKRIWKICGLCEKYETKENDEITTTIIQYYGTVADLIQESEQMYSESIVKSNISHNVSNKQQEVSKSVLTSINFGPNKKVVLSKKNFDSKLLNVDTMHQDEKDIDVTINACVPNISASCKWRVIPVSKRFAHISFSRCDFVLEYDDIMNSISAARRNSVTVVIQSHILLAHYPHRKYGVYCDYRAPDKIFVGPYFTNEKLELKFMIFLKKVLVEIEIGWWYRQSAVTSDDDVQLVQPLSTLIDLTCESDNEDQVTQISLDRSSDINELPESSNSNVDQNWTQEAESESTKRSPRFIMTNIPNIGYIEAHLHNNSLDVILCPINRIPRRFTHWSTAITSLHRIMSCRFTFVPASFKLEVTMVEELDTTKHKRMNKNILNGCYVAGEFGVRHIANITPEDLSAFALSQYETHAFLQIRERKLLQIIVIHLSKLLNIDIPIETPSFNLLMNLADKTLLEIDELKKQNSSYAIEKADLEIKKKSLMSKCLSLINLLPADKHSTELKKLNYVSGISASKKILNKPANNEIISIDDDNDYESGEKVDGDRFENCDKVSNQEESSYTDNSKDSTIKALLSTPSSQPQSELEFGTRIKQIKTTSNATQKNGIVNVQHLQSLNKLTASPRTYRITKDNILTANEVSSQHKVNLQSKSILKPLTSQQFTNAKHEKSVGSLKKVLNTVPVLTKIVIPETTPINSTPSPNNLPNLVGIGTSGTLNNVKSGKSTNLSHGDAQDVLKRNSLATLTSIPNSVGNRSNKPDIIALKDGDQMKYFKFVSNQKKSNTVSISLPSNFIKTPPK